MLDLASFLLKPVQRICKYPLLLREIIKHTPDNHRDRACLESAYKSIELIVNGVNEYTRQLDNSRIVLDIQKRFVEKIILYLGPPRNPRVYLGEEMVLCCDHVDGEKKGKKNESARVLILFDDLLVVGKGVGSGGEKTMMERLEIVGIMRIDDVVVKSFDGTKGKRKGKRGRDKGRVYGK